MFGGYMSQEQFFGTYYTFNTASKKDASLLLGADNLVGDIYNIVFKKEDNTTIAWLLNRFGQEIAFFDQDISRKLALLQARNWNIKAVLSFIAFTESPEPGCYWGECAVLAWPKTLDGPMTTFLEKVSKRIGEGVRPNLELGKQGVQQIIETQGSWQPTSTIPLPKKKPGTVIMKSHLKLSEKMIEQGRKGNKGCYVVSWVFLLTIVALIVIFGKSCMGF